MQESKITNCTICNELSLVKKYRDEWVCITCAGRLAAMNRYDMRLTGDERITLLRKELYGNQS